MVQVYVHSIIILKPQTTTVFTVMTWSMPEDKYPTQNIMDSTEAFPVWPVLCCSPPPQCQERTPHPPDSPPHLPTTVPPIVHPNAVEELKCNIVHLLRDSIVTTLHGTARFVQLLEDLEAKAEIHEPCRVGAWCILYEMWGSMDNFYLCSDRTLKSNNYMTCSLSADWVK